MLKITPLQTLWLYSRGGRTEMNVVVRNKNLYVIMRSKRRNVLVEIPSDKGISLDYHTNKRNKYQVNRVLCLRKSR